MYVVQLMIHVHVYCFVLSKLLNTGKFSPRFIFAFLPEGEFKTGLIELHLKDCVRKLASERIQDWANQSQISQAR